MLTVGVETKRQRRQVISATVHRVRRMLVVTLGALALAGVSAVPVLGGLARASAQSPPQFYVNGALPHMTGTLASSGVPVFSWGTVEMQTGVGGITCTDELQGRIGNENGRGVGEIQGFDASDCRDPELCAHIIVCGVFGKEGYGEYTVFVSAEMPLRPHKREAVVCLESAKGLSECPLESEREVVHWPELNIARRGTSLPWPLHTTRTVREEEEVPTLSLGPEAQNCYPTETTVVEGKQMQVPVEWAQVPAGCVKLDVIVPQLPGELVYYGQLEPELLNGVKNGLFPSRASFVAPEPLLQAGGGSEGATREDHASLTGELRLAGASGVELITAK